MHKTLFLEVTEYISEILQALQALPSITLNLNPEDKEVAKRAGNKLYKVSSLLEDAAFDRESSDPLAEATLQKIEVAITKNYDGDINGLIRLLQEILESTDVQQRAEKEKLNKR